MNHRIIAIGDIHGCAVALRTLLDAIRPQPDDTLVTLGDCVDRGPDSRAVIDRLLRLHDVCRLVPLLGNHEEMMLDFLDGKPQPIDWLEYGGAATLAAYRARRNVKNIPESHVAFLRTWEDCFETPDHFLVHGSYEPDVPLAEQPWNRLRWQSLADGRPAPHGSGKTAIVGHTPQRTGEILDAGHLICIDTFCYGGGWLTALDTTSGQVWQTTNRGDLRGQ
jgi:serine/threonine protein phosphatase 1